MQNDFKSFRSRVKEPEFVPLALIHTNCVIFRWLLDLSKAELHSFQGDFENYLGVQM